MSEENPHAPGANINRPSALFVAKVDFIEYQGSLSFTWQWGATILTKIVGRNSQLPAIGGGAVNCALLYLFILFLSAIAATIEGLGTRANNVDAIMRRANQAFKKSFTEELVRKPWPRSRLSDTAGNMAEWVEDCWSESYHEAHADGSAWTKGKCSLRRLRGCSSGIRSRFRYDSDVRCESSCFRVLTELC